MAHTFKENGERRNSSVSHSLVIGKCFDLSRTRIYHECQVVEEGLPEKKWAGACAASSKPKPRNKVGFPRSHRFSPNPLSCMGRWVNSTDDDISTLCNISDRHKGPVFFHHVSSGVVYFPMKHHRFIFSLFLGNFHHCSFNTYPLSSFT